MVSNSRRAKEIDVGSREAPISEGGSAVSHKLSVGAPSSNDALQKREPNLLAWLSKRYADVSKSISREHAERSGSSEEFITVPEAASALRISERTLRRHLKEGRIPHIRIGKQIRIPREALMRGWKNE